MTKREFWFWFRFKTTSMIMRINWVMVIFAILITFLILPNITPNGIKCWRLGGRPDLYFDCYRTIKETIKVE